MQRTVEVNSESIKRMIENQGFKQVDVSRMLGMKDNTLSASLSSGRMNIETLERLAIFLRVPKETLLPVETQERQDKEAPADAVKESTVQALFMAVKQLHQAVSELSDEVSVIKTQDKNYYVATSKILEKMFNQIRYDPTRK